MYKAAALLKYRTSFKGRFNSAKHRRDKGTYAFTLTFDEWKKLAIQPCHYCGGVLNPQGLGLDRMNNAQGYTPENVVPCCRQCNTMKNSFLTHEEMKAAMSAVLDVRRSK